MSFQNVMDELRLEYLTTFDNKLVVLHETLEKCDLERAELEFHKMKGTGKTYGIAEISDVGEVFESLCQQKADSFREWLPLSFSIIKKVVAAHQSNREVALSEDGDFIKAKGLLA